MFLTAVYSEHSLNCKNSSLNVQFYELKGNNNFRKRFMTPTSLKYFHL